MPSCSPSTPIGPTRTLSHLKPGGGRGASK
jgi:hypothetical protein